MMKKKLSLWDFNCAQFIKIYRAIRKTTMKWKNVRSIMSSQRNIT